MILTETKLSLHLNQWKLSGYKMFRGAFAPRIFLIFMKIIQNSALIFHIFKYFLKKVLTNTIFCCKIQLADFCGGIAQLARAIGSYPIGRRFKSTFRYQ